MDADIVMSPENDAVDVAYNAALSSRCWRWLSRLCGSGNANPESAFDDRTSRRRPQREAVTFALDWANSMRPFCVHGVEITCIRIIMANCVVGVGPFLP